MIPQRPIFGPKPRDEYKAENRTPFSRRRLVEHDPTTFCAQLWQRYYHVVGRLHVRIICLVKVESNTSRAEEGGEDEIEFTIRKTIEIGKSETFFPQLNPIEKLTSFPNNTATPLRKEQSSSPSLE